MSAVTSTTDPRVAARAQELLSRHERSIFRRTDRIFLWLLPAQWAAGIVGALAVSPRVWADATHQAHLHLYAAVLLGGLIAAPPVALALTKPGERSTRHAIAASQAMTSALLIHLSGGRIETHFHVFGSLAFLAFYRDWTVLATATALFTADHLVRGMLWPQSIFGALGASPWLWLEHTGWILFEDVFLVYSCIQARKSTQHVALHRATLEATKDGIEEEVEQRTAQLRSANRQLERTMQERAEATSERDRMQVQLQHAQKLEAVGQLAAGIAHEINTPTQYVGDNTRFLQDTFGEIDRLLAAYADVVARARAGEPLEEALGALDGLVGEVEPDFLREEIPWAIEQSLDGVARVSSIVRAMKDFSHPGVEDMTRVDLNRAIESTATVCRNEWKYYAKLDLDLDPALPQVECLPSEINQVVLNIIVNAAHAIAESQEEGQGDLGTIRISTRPDGGSVEIRIEDTGPGMPAEVRRKVFEPFFTTKGVGKGTGQGLAIAHGVVTKKHGGTIGVESTVGVGTTFSIRLPITQEESTAAAA